MVEIGFKKEESKKDATSDTKDSNTSNTVASKEFSLPKLYLWVKSLEGKVNNLNREMIILKNDFIKRNNDMRKHLSILSDDIMEMRKNEENSSKKMDIIIKELKMTAGSEEVDVIKKYLDIWSPLNFVSQRDLERMVERKFKELENEKKKKPEK